MIVWGELLLRDGAVMVRCPGDRIACEVRWVAPYEMTVQSVAGPFHVARPITLPDDGFPVGSLRYWSEPVGGIILRTQYLERSDLDFTVITPADGIHPTGRFHLHEGMPS